MERLPTWAAGARITLSVLLLLVVELGSGHAQDPYQAATYGGPPLTNGGSFTPPSTNTNPATLNDAATENRRGNGNYDDDSERTDDASSPVVTGDLFEPGEVLATVGDQFILAADVLPHVDQVLESYRGKVPEEAIQKQRRMVVAQLTASHVEVKLLYLAFLRKVPDDKIKEIHKKVDVSFDKELEDSRRKVDAVKKADEPDFIKKDPHIARLVILMREKNAWSPGELDLLLKKYGGSLAQEKRYYAETKLGRAMVSNGLNFQPEISHDEMLNYYRDHDKEYQFPDRVRFEIMSVRFPNFPTRELAWQAIANMGNEVFYGAKFSAVAKRSSQGLNSEEGGFHDWTPRGALASGPLNEALFSLEIDKLSQVIEDDRGYHIVRVLERETAGKVAFEAVQNPIREKIRQEKISVQYKAIVKKIKGGTKIWTAFDDDPALAKVVHVEERNKMR